MAARFAQHHHVAPRAVAGRPGHLVGRPVHAGVEGAPVPEHLDHPVHLVGPYAVEALAGPVHLQYPDATDRRGASIGAPRPGAQRGGVHHVDVRRVDRGPGLRVLDLARVAEPFGARHDGREVDLGPHPLVVVLQPGVHGVTVHLQLACPGQEGELQQFGHLGGHLAGVGIDGVAAAEHQVPWAPPVQRGRQRPCRGQGVAPGERRIGHVQAARAATQDCLAQHCVGRRWPEGDGRARPAGRLCQVTPGPDATTAVVVHVELEAVPYQATVCSQPHLLELRDLLHQGGDPQRSVTSPVGHGANVPAYRVPPGRPTGSR